MAASWTKSAERRDLETRWESVLKEAPSTEDFRRAYDEQYELAVREGRVADPDAEPDALDRIVARRIGTGKRVLDIGCGMGVGSFALARQGNAVVGVDVARACLDRLRERARREPELDLRAELADARELPLEADSFDYAVSQNLVEHLSCADGRRHMKAVWRVLKPGGCYLCFVPSRVFSGKRSVGLHLCMYSLRELIRLATSRGFRPRWMETKLTRLGLPAEMPRWVLPPAYAYEKGLELLKRSFPRLRLQIAGCRITPTTMVAAYKPQR